MLSKKAVSKVFVKGEQMLFQADTFIFEHTVWKYGPSMYNLEDSKETKSKSYAKDTVEYYSIDSGRFRRGVELIGAPESWLLKNNYKEKE